MHSLYATTRSTHFVVSVTAENFISAQPLKSICAEMKIQSCSFKLGTLIYIPEHISQHPTHLGYTHIYIKYVYVATSNMYTCVKHVDIAVTTANTPLDRRLDGHALTAHTYRSVEAYRSIHYHSSKWHPYNFTPYG